jgi:hypothetical protein
VLPCLSQDLVLAINDRLGESSAVDELFFRQGDGRGEPAVPHAAVVARACPMLVTTAVCRRCCSLSTHATRHDMVTSEAVIVAVPRRFQ